MSSPATLRPLVVVLGEPPVASMTGAEIIDLVAEHADVASARDPEAMAALAREDSREVAVVAIVGGGTGIDETIESLDRLGALGTAAIVVVTTEEHHSDVAQIVDAGRLAAIVMVGTPGIVGWIVAAQLRWWMAEHGYDPVSLPEQPAAPAQESAFMATLHASEDDLVASMFEAIELALGPRALLHLPPNTRLTRQGEDAHGVFIVLEGHVALTRASEGASLLLHHASTGPVVGLLSLTRRRKAFFTSTTTTDVTAIHLSLEQLDRAMRLQPQLGMIIASLSMRTLTQRLLRSEEQQFERDELNRELEAERSRLAAALKSLEEARLELISQARFATLGELSAGVAHELNNPVAAIAGVAGHIKEDLRAVLAGHPQEGVLEEILEVASRRAPIATSVQRSARRALEELTQDPEYSWGLVGAGVVDSELAARAHAVARQAALGAAAIASASRNIDIATARIRELVTSLREYSRPESDVIDDVDVNAVLEDTLHLLSHRLRDIEVIHEPGELPLIAAHPSQLGQVWTNIIVNAADVLTENGQIDIITRQIDSETIEVRIRDNGPGIPPDVLPRIFEPRFSTKTGTVRFGLGLGLGISRRIVEEHGGSLTATSQPGRTEMTVTLPIAGPIKEDV